MLAFFATMVARLAISPVVPDIVDAFDVSHGLVGLALSGMWAAYALSQFPSGVLGDRYGERVVILTAVGGTAVASLLLALSPSFALFALVAVGLGAAAGLHYSVATTLLTRQFDDIGRAIGVHVAGGPLAGLLAPIAAAAVGARYGWQAAIATGAAVAIPVFILFAWRVERTEPRVPDEPIRERVALDGLRELLTRPEIAYTTGLAIIGAFTWQATASFLPAFLEEGQAFSRTMAGALFSLYFVVHGATQPLLGALSDRYSRDAAVAGTMVMGTGGYLLLVGANGTATTVLAVVVVGVSMSWGAPLQSRFMDNLADAERGRGFGLVRTVYMTVGAAGSVVVGALADLVGWEVAFGLLAVVMGIALAAIVTNRLFSLGY